MEKENNVNEERKRSAFTNAMSNYGLEMQLVEETKMEIIDLLKNTGRENIDKVVEWLEQNRFFEAMASIHYHNHYYGGLASHSLDVYRLATKLNAECETPLPEDSVTLCSLLHDVCKSDLYYYDREERRTKKHEEIAAQGHGIRSVRILKSCGLPLSHDEELAIWWHMGEHEQPFDHPEVYESTKNNPLCNLIRKADQEASTVKKLNHD